MTLANLFKRYGALLLVLPLSIAPALAQESTPAPGPAARSEATGPVFSAQFENDMFFGSSDRHYTHGSRLSYLTGEDDVPDRVLEWVHYLPIYETQPHARFSLSLGQSIFTPEDITQPVPDPTDRPYAGWLYGGFGLVTYGDDGERRDSLELALGVVGPWSQAEEVQTTWHDWFNFREPRGWEYQIRNEPGVMLSWDTQDRWIYEELPLGLEWDVTPNWGVTLGNVMTYANVGGMVRLGTALDNDFGPPRIRPSLPGSGFFISRDVFTWYVFAGIEGRAVGRNIFLDGNTFRDSPSVDRRNFVGDLQAGFSMGWNDVRIGYTQIWRSREYRGQDSPDLFGAISLSLRF